MDRGAGQAVCSGSCEMPWRWALFSAIDLLGVSREIFLAVYDNIESIQEEMRGGRIHAIIEQHPEMIGELGVEAAVQKMNGVALPLYRATPLGLVTYEHFGKNII